jgi:hypothetical protein
MRTDLHTTTEPECDCGFCEFREECANCDNHAERSSFHGGNSAIKAGVLSLVLAVIILIVSMSVGGCAGYDTTVAFSYEGVGTQVSIRKANTGKQPVEVQK